MMTTATYNKTDKSAYMVLGMFFGMVAGMLLAPRSGEETRAKLREHAMNAKQKAGEQLSNKGNATMQAINKSLNKAQDKAEDVIHTSQDMAETATDIPGNMSAQATTRRRSTTP
jgi:gas vesicle protein